MFNKTRTPQIATNLGLRTTTLCASIALCGCATGPEALLRSHAYEGPTKPPAELATIFVSHPGLQTYHTLICSVNGKSYRRLGAISSCPSVVFVPAGTHRLSLETRYANLYGNHSYNVSVEAGHTYEVTTTPTARDAVSFNTRKFAHEHVLTYRQLAPVFFTKEGYADGPVPVASN